MSKQNLFPYKFTEVKEGPEGYLSPIMEPIIFTHISEVMVMKAKVSEIHPIINRVACDWQIKLSTVRGFKTVQRIILNSVLNN